MRYLRSILSFITVASLGLPSGAWAAVGKVPGSFNVSQTGAANYSIPIWAPPGPHGLQPALSVAYNHRGGIGPLGVGWSLTGLSSITRCNKTLAQDGAASPVTLTYNDVFCLDGQRLRLTSSTALSTYGQDGTTYQTQIANFSNVTAHGTQGNGPSYFTVQRRDGLTYEYGNGANSQIRGTDAATTAMQWLLDKVTDRAGNTMTIAWVAPSTTLSGTSVPDVISWTPVTHGASTYQYSMQFSYTTNVPQSSQSAYLAGSKVLNQDLLAAISIKNNAGATIKQYVFNYQTSPTTGGYRLQQVQECADSAATNCLLPTTISYQNGVAGVSTSGSTVTFGSGVNWYFANYDLDGDGYKDLIYQVGTAWYAAFGSPSGYGAAHAIVTTSAYLLGQFVLPGDLFGNGRDGLLAKNGTDWYYYTWNGSAFVGQDTHIAYDTASPDFALADTNGDGRPDLISVHTTVGVGATVYIQLNTSTSPTTSFGSQIAAYTLSDSLITAASLYSQDMQQAGALRYFDFNGDGNQDVVLGEGWTSNRGVSHGVYYQLLSNGSTFSGSILPNIPDNSTPPLFVHWNDDACTDYVSNTTLVVSACNGASGGLLTLAAKPLTTIDWDGDGRTDLVFGSGSSLSIQLSNGQGLGATVSTSVPWTTTAAYRPFEANGDGLQDLGAWNGSTFTYYLHNGANQPPDLLTGVSDGYGISFNPTYTSILWGAYARSANATTYPERDFQRPFYVVNQATVSDGIGGMFVRTYGYVGAREQLQGYGFEGFESVTASDSRAASLVSKTTFQQYFPFTGMAIQSDTFQHDGVTTVSHATFTNQEALLNSTSYDERRFPYVQSSTVQTREVGGVKNGALITTTARTNTFDPTYLNFTASTTTVTDNDSTSPFLGQQWSSTTATTYSIDTGSNWCLTLPTGMTVTNSAPGVPSIMRTTAFNGPADYANCRPTSITTEPSSSSYAVTKSLGYDAFGNVNSVTVTGTGMAGRTSTVDWGATGQFPVTLRDPLSNSLGSAGYKTVKGYDYNLGVQTSEVVQSADGSVANAPPVSWQYDPFGRRQLETRPDGTYTSWTYNDCASSGGCFFGSHGLIVGQAVQSTDGSVQTDGSTWLDQMGRAVLSTSRALAAGAYTKSGAQYDNFGRVRVRDIPCAWTGSITHCSNGVTSSFDALGRVVQIQRPISATNTSPQTETIQYSGRTTVSTDPYGKTTTKISTVVGTLGVSQDHDGYHQNFAYDAFGSLLSVTDSLSRTLFTADYDYGIAAFQRDATDMDLDVSTAAGQHRHYNYDALGELVSWSDAKGQSFSETYDLLSRPRVRTEPDLTTTWTYGSSASAHNVGQLQSVSAGSYAESYTYDSIGRASNRSISIPSDGTYNYDFSYNSTTGRLDTLTYPTTTSSYRLKLTYAYQNGMLQKVSDFNAGTVFWQANTANARGQITQETLGNGVITNRSFDDVTGWMSSMTSGLNGTTALQNESYLFDELGNVTQRQNNNAGLTENFYYDDLYRLDHSTLNATINLQMAYGADGNITSRSDVAGGATWTYDPNHKHAVTQAGSNANTYTYDSNGNAISRNGVGITWTSYNHPSIINNSGSGESVQFAYDQNHERWIAVLSASSGVETTYFIGGLMEKAVQAGGIADYRHYILVGKTKVAVYSRTTGGTNTLRYIREDHLGSAAAILADDGTSYVKESFSAFGVRRNACTWSGAPTNGALTRINAVTRRGYTWQTALGNMGLNDMNGRVQDAVTGRFLSADPTIPNPGLTQHFNRYSYVYNNPLSYTDPSGFEGEEASNEKPVDGWNPSAVATPVLSVPQIMIMSPKNSPPVTGAVTALGDSYSAPTMGSSSGGAGLPEVVISGKRPKPPSAPVSPPIQQIPCAMGVVCLILESDELPEVTITAKQQYPFSPLSCAKAGIGCNRTNPPPPICFGSFYFAGREADFEGGSYFAGQLLESTVEGLDVGPLYEGSIGPEGVTVGGAITQSLRTGKTSGFAFGGGKLSAGPLAGIQVGAIAGPNELGLYVEGHRGPTAHGTGIAISICPE